MRKKPETRKFIRFSQIIFLSILTLSLLQITKKPVEAHPADLFLQKLSFTFAEDQLFLDWRITPDPIMSHTVWAETDLDGDGLVSESEARTYLASVTLLLETGQTGAEKLRWEIKSWSWPASLQLMEQGQESIQFNLSAELDIDKTPLKFEIRNLYQETFSINWFSLDGGAEWQFLGISQKKNWLGFEVWVSSAEAEGALSRWDSARPDLAGFGGSGQVDSTSPVSSTQSRLSAYLQTAAEERSAGFYLLAFAGAFLMGGLHAFTPGHGKSVVSAYMVGSRGNWLQSLVLGLVIAITHTGTVILSGVLILLASSVFMPNTLFPVFEILSGLIITLIGGFLLRQRVLFLRGRQVAAEQPALIIPNPEKENAARIILHKPVLEDSPPHLHAGPKYIPKNRRADTSRLEWRTLLALGTSGGLVPCPDAIAILILGSSAGQTLFGSLLIFIFSLGISAVLMGVGLSVLQGKKLLSRFKGFERALPFAPLASSLIVLLLGLVLLGSSLNKYQQEVGSLLAAANPFKQGSALGDFFSTEEKLENKSILFLKVEEDYLAQIYRTTPGSQTAEKLTSEKFGVSDFIPAPEAETLFYAAYDKDSTNSRIVLLNLQSGEAETVYEAQHSLLRGLLLSPDKTRLLFENSRLPSLENPYGLTNIWVLDLFSGQAQPLMKNEDFVSYNPAFSPDMAWFSFTSPSDNKIYVRSVDGERNIELANTIGNKLVWAADSSAFLYTDYDNPAGGRSHLYFYSLKDGEKSDLTETVGNEVYLAAWNPAGEQAVLSARAGGEGEGIRLWLLELHNLQTEALTPLCSGFQINLSWSAGGRYVLFEQLAASKTDQRAGIWVVDSRTGENVRITDEGQEPHWAEWE